MMNIAFLYTLKANQALFKPYIDKYLKNLPVTVSHHTNEGLLQNAMKDGLTAQVTNDVQQAITEIAANNADIIICTCSTIGDLAEKTPNIASKVLRVDRQMAEAALQHNNILVLAALASTLTPTVELLHAINSEITTDKHPDQTLPQPVIATQLISAAWPYHTAGDTEMYARTIAAHINTLTTKADIVLLAQASMAPAIQYCNKTSFAILTSPEMCLGYLAKRVKLHA